MNRTHNIDELLAHLQQKWGRQALQPLTDLAAHADCIPTGFPALDAAIGGGGIPRNRLTAFCGQPTSGMTSLAYSVIAGAQANQLVVVYLDAPQTFDPEYALYRGVDMDLLLHVRPETWGEALEMLRDVTGIAVAGLLVLDASLADIDAPEKRKALAATLQRVAALLPQSTWTLLTLIPPDLPVNVDSGSALRLLAERLAWLREDGTLSGYQTRVTVLKNKFGPAGEQVIIDLTLRG